MLSHFDLWSYDDVKANADAILQEVETGAMPCDGPWPAGKVDTFRSWLAAGAPSE